MINRVERTKVSIFQMIVIHVLIRDLFFLLSGVWCLCVVHLNFRALIAPEPGSVGLSGGVPVLCFFGALLNGCNFRSGRGDGWSMFPALINV